MPSQNQLSASDIKKKLEGYTLLKNNQIAKLVPGDRIRYMVNNQFRAGGTVRSSSNYPVYIVLVNVINNVSWCVQLKDPTLKIWCKSLKAINAEKDEKNLIYSQYKAGKLKKYK